MKEYFEKKFGQGTAFDLGSRELCGPFTIHKKSTA